MPISEFARELASEALSLDSRLRLTMRALFLEPGRVPQEYVAGHRARHVPPIRLYLFASFAMFLIMSLGSGVTMSNIRVNGEAVAQPVDVTEGDEPVVDEPVADDVGDGTGFENRLRTGFERALADRGDFNREFLNRVAQAMFVLLPAFALLLKLVSRRRLYVQHLVFAIYLHSFAFLVVAVVGIPDTLGLSNVGKVLSVSLLWIPVYFVLGMKRFYGGSWPSVLAKSVFVLTTYAVLTGVTWMGLLVVSVLAA